MASSFSSRNSFFLRTTGLSTIGAAAVLVTTAAAAMDCRCRTITSTPSSSARSAVTETTRVAAPEDFLFPSDCNKMLPPCNEDDDNKDALILNDRSLRTFPLNEKLKGSSKKCGVSAINFLPSRAGYIASSCSNENENHRRIQGRIFLENHKEKAAPFESRQQQQEGRSSIKSFLHETARAVIAVGSRADNTSCDSWVGGENFPQVQRVSAEGVGPRVDVVNPATNSNEDSEEKQQNPLKTKNKMNSTSKTADPRVAASNNLHENTAADSDDTFPNFSRHGKGSLLKRYLTEAVYRKLQHMKTSSGVTLEDCIRAGTSLPWGAKPPRGVAGVYAGDAESYHAFSLLFMPLIQEHHKATNRSRGGLQRHKTDLNPKQLIQQKLDPEGEYILYTRMRLARSLTGFRFSPCIGRAERRAVERLVQECVSDWSMVGDPATTNPYGSAAYKETSGKYVSVMNMSNSQHDDLVRRRVLFPDPDDFAISTGAFRDWPDARGMYCDTWEDTPHIMIWTNFEDHLWIISNAKGGDVQGVFTRLSTAVHALEGSLKKRGHTFVEDKRLGFLNASPANIGTALRASVYVKLVRLGQLPGFEDLINRLRLEVKTEYSKTDKRYTGIFDIANAEALGKSEVELINVMIEGVGKLIALEKKLENGDHIDLSTVK